MTSLSILREFFNTLGIYRDPMNVRPAAQYLADGGKIPQAVEKNIVRGNALLSRMKAMG